MVGGVSRPISSLSKILALLKFSVGPILVYIELKQHKWQLFIYHCKRRQVTILKIFKPISTRYCLISIHYATSAYSFSGFETIFKTVLQNCQNLSTCICHYNIWIKCDSLMIVIIIITAQIKEEIYDSLNSRMFSMDRKDAAKRPEEQVTNYPLINTSLMTAKREEKSTYGVDWRQKGTWHGPTKLANRLPQNIQEIRQSHKVYQKYHGKLESGTDSRRKKLNWGENPEKDLPEGYAITIIICNSDDATQSHI